MAITLLSGKMLEANLERGNVNLSVENDQLFFDVANNRIGVNNAAPTTDLDVTGGLKSTTATIGNISLATNTISATGGSVTVSALTLNTAGNITSAADMGLTTTANGDLIITTGTGIIDYQCTSALALPSGTTLERPGTAVPGMTRWNEDNTEIEYYDGSTWRANQESFVPTSQQIIPTGTENTYVLDKAATTASILVIINGLVQDPDAGVYSVVGAALLFTENPLPGDIISVRFLTV